jgi:uncharacterized membrane protein YecN with MAPEG domain
LATTALYAVLLTLLFLLLSLRVIAMRRRIGGALGDGGNLNLLRRIRVHGNFAEYVPLALILLGLAESLHTPDWMLHGLGIVLLMGRVSHAAGVAQANERFVFRVAGMALTFVMLGAAAAACAYGVMTHPR